MLGFSGMKAKCETVANHIGADGRVVRQEVRFYVASKLVKTLQVTGTGEYVEGQEYDVEPDAAPVALEPAAPEPSVADKIRSTVVKTIDRVKAAHRAPPPHRASTSKHTHR
jgi:hypothetical protein